MCFYLAMAGNESLSIVTLFKPNASDLHAGGSGSKRGIHSAGLTTWPQSSFLLYRIHCGIKKLQYCWTGTWLALPWYVDQ